MVQDKVVRAKAILGKGPAPMAPGSPGAKVAAGHEEEQVVAGSFVEDVENSRRT